MIVRIYKEETYPEVLCEKEVKGTIDKTKDMYRFVNQQAFEFLGEYLDTEILQTGIRWIRDCREFYSTYKIRSGMPELTISGNRTIIGGAAEKEDRIEWSDPVVTKEGKTDMRIGIDIFDTGFIVATTKKTTDIFGRQHDAYFRKITSKNFVCSGRRSAKVFKDEKALLKYLKEKQEIFKGIVRSRGDQFSVEPTCSQYIEWWKKPVDEAVMEQIHKLLDEINETTPEEPEFTIGENEIEEALIRMRELNLHKPVINDFKTSGKIYMSEFGGILYDLDDDAKIAVKEASDYGMPYHVIRTQSTEVGDMYAVLYVSQFKEEWGYEHRDPRTGAIPAHVYNVAGFSDAGYICVSLENGGLHRTA